MVCNLLGDFIPNEQAGPFTVHFLSNALSAVCCRSIPGVCLGKIFQIVVIEYSVAAVPLKQVDGFSNGHQFAV